MIARTGAEDFEPGAVGPETHNPAAVDLGLGDDYVYQGERFAGWLARNFGIDVFERPTHHVANQLTVRDLTHRVLSDPEPVSQQSDAVSELADLLEAAYNIYRQGHPWVADYQVAPKSVARDMYERAMTFVEYVGFYGLARSEGLVLRYLAEGVAPQAPKVNVIP